MKTHLNKADIDFRRRLNERANCGLPSLAQLIRIGKEPVKGTIILCAEGTASYRYAGRTFMEKNTDYFHIRFILGISKDDGSTLISYSTAGQWFVTDEIQKMPNPNNKHYRV